MRLERRNAVLFPPFGISVEQAARAVGVSPNTYLNMVEDGRMPRPKRIGSRKVWDVEEVQAAFKALPHDKQIDDGDTDTWSDVAAR
jgi:predicted DNA-binding transcriptional regulator AlpA